MWSPGQPNGPSPPTVRVRRSGAEAALPGGYPREGAEAPTRCPGRRQIGRAGSRVGAVVSVRPMATPPGARDGAGCPNLLQRPPSHRRAGGETLIFRASPHRRSRPEAPLQQIWTNPRPRPSQEPHTHHCDPLNPCSRRRRSRRCTAAAISPGLRGAEVRKVHPHSSLHSHYYQQHRHRRTVALYCHGPVERQGIRSCEKVAPAYF